VVVVPYLVHRFPGVWDHPDEFRPNRFAKGGAADRLRSENPFVYVPFSAGPRNCIGQKFAEMEELLAVATVTRRFRFHLENEADVLPNQELILRPVRGIRVRVERRL
jgi:cytochrome P450 family 4